MKAVRIHMLAFLLCAGMSACSSRAPVGEVSNGDAAAGGLISRAGTRASEPALAADANNTVYAVWVEHGEGRNADVFVRKLDPDGRPLSDQTRVNPTAGEATAWSGDPPTIIASGEKVYVGWTARFEDAPPPATTLYLSVSSDGGNTFATPVKVNDDSGPASHGMHSMALGADGKVYFAWIDERYLKKNSEPEHAIMIGGHEEAAMAAKQTPAPSAAAEAEPDGELYFAVWEGGVTFGPNQRLSGEACPCCKSSIIAAGDGAFYIGFRKVFPGQRRHIAVVASRGGQFGEAIQVSDDQWMINACPVSGPSLHLDGSGRLTAAWYTEGTAGEKGLYVARMENGAAEFGPRILASTDAAPGTPILTENFIIWGKTGEFFAAPINYSDLKVGTPAASAEGERAAAVEIQGRPFFAVSRKDDETSGIWIGRSRPRSKSERLDVHTHQ